MIIYIENGKLFCIDEDNVVDMIDDMMDNTPENEKQNDIKISIAPEDKIKLCELFGGDAFIFSLEERLESINEDLSRLEEEKNIIECVKADYIEYKKGELNEN
jgi:hypothetical protein